MAITRVLLRAFLALTGRNVFGGFAGKEVIFFRIITPDF